MAKHWSPMKILASIPIGVALLLGPQAGAEEGLWTFNDFPAQRVAAEYGFAPSAEWLRHVQIASLRIPGVCSGSFVSMHGLVLTNHHCVLDCLSRLTGNGKDYFANPFVALRGDDEARCPDVELDQLISITDVTERIHAATDGQHGEAFEAALNATMTAIEAACPAGAAERCDVVKLYHGGEFDLYRSHVFRDVRLAFSPEYAAAEFGGDPDNFSFPRHAFDLALYRVYEDGRPIDSAAYFLPLSPNGAAAGELTFVSGNPGATSRFLTVDQLEFDRDTRLPYLLGYYGELAGVLWEYARRGDAERRAATADLESAENLLKLFKGQLATILMPDVFAAKQKAEQSLRGEVAADDAMQRVAGAWAAVGTAVQDYRPVFLPYLLLEGPQGGRPYGFRSRLMEIGRGLVRLGAELPKPDAQRLREYTDANLPATMRDLLDDSPIDPGLEIEALTFSLRRIQEDLGADDGFVRRLFRDQSPAGFARSLIRRTSLASLPERNRLLQGGADAVRGSNDPIIEIWRDIIDPYARVIRSRYESSVAAPFESAGGRIARARFALHGTSGYPDGTGTLRLSYGRAAGPVRNGTAGAYVTTIGGAFDRSTGSGPFALPASWLSAKDRLDLSLPLDIATTDETVSGNSGSPLLNRKAEIVGVVFDSNLAGRGDIYADLQANRAVSVDSRCILEILSKVYGATRIVDELAAGRMQ